MGGRLSRPHSRASRRPLTAARPRRRQRRSAGCRGRRPPGTSVRAAGRGPPGGAGSCSHSAGRSLGRSRPGAGALEPSLPPALPRTRRVSLLRDRPAAEGPELAARTAAPQRGRRRGGPRRPRAGPGPRRSARPKVARVRTMRRGLFILPPAGCDGRGEGSGGGGGGATRRLAGGRGRGRSSPRAPGAARLTPPRARLRKPGEPGPVPSRPAEARERPWRAESPCGGAEQRRAPSPPRRSGSRCGAARAPARETARPCSGEKSLIPRVP